MNMTQEKLVAEGLMLPLMEAFYTIQGEGYHSGKSAFFLRIGGCDVVSNLSFKKHFISLTFFREI